MMTPDQMRMMEVQERKFLRTRDAHIKLCEEDFMIAYMQDKRQHIPEMEKAAWMFCHILDIYTCLVMEMEEKEGK